MSGPTPPRWSSNGGHAMMRGQVGRRGVLGIAKGAIATAVLGSPARGSTQRPDVKIGYILPVTGPLAYEAQLSLNGLQLAVDEINGAGGVKAMGGAKLILLAGDTQ